MKIVIVGLELLQAGHELLDDPGELEGVLALCIDLSLNVFDVAGGRLIHINKLVAHYF